MPAKARSAVQAYLQQDSELRGITGEEAGDAYQFHTSGIQDMVNNLKDKMSDERATVEKEEAEKKHAFQYPPRRTRLLPLLSRLDIAGTRTPNRSRKRRAT